MHFTNNDLRGNTEKHKVVYIEYQDGMPHAAITQSTNPKYGGQEWRAKVG